MDQWQQELDQYAQYLEATEDSKLSESELKDKQSWLGASNER